MSYPALSRADALEFLAGRSKTLRVLQKPSGPPFRWEERIAALVSDIRPVFNEAEALAGARSGAGASKSEEWQRFEAEAAIAVHMVLPAEHEALADREFWLWLACDPFRDIIERRYRSADGRPVNRANFGLSGFAENFVYRLWIRADCVFNPVGGAEREPYDLARRGQSDFWRSHVFRQGYGARRAFTRALVRFAYPDPAKPSAPALRVEEVRELAKRLRKLASNLVIDVLDEKESEALIQETANDIRAQMDNQPKLPRANDRRVVNRDQASGSRTTAP